MLRGIYECVNCGYREVLDFIEFVIERVCFKCGGDMILVGYVVSGVEFLNVCFGREEVLVFEGSGVFFGVEVLRELFYGFFLEVEVKLNEFYFLRFYGFDGYVVVFEVFDIYEKNFERVFREFENFGYWVVFKKRDGRIVFFVFFVGKIFLDNLWFFWFFFVFIVFLMFFVGYYLVFNYIVIFEYYGFLGFRNLYIIVFFFLVSVMVIIGIYELVIR